MQRGTALVMVFALAFSLVFDSTAATARLSRRSSRTLAGEAPRAKTNSPTRIVSPVGAPSVKTAPNGPPLTLFQGGAEAEDTAGVQSLEGDQLVENGLSSPLCEAGKVSALSTSAQSNCQTSGFVGAPAPTNNYDLDVNVNTGTLGLGNGQLISVIQDVLVAPIWESLVWLVHALVVMLQWCYTLELLGGSMTSGLRSALGQAQASFTEPWLALVLSAASVLAVYNGLIRRRVGETLGQILLTVTMMAVGLWLIADPLGTIGTVGQFANRTSLSTLSVVLQGTAVGASRTLGESMRVLFADTIEVPWCYLEFGDVRWCSEPVMLEPRLRAAALKIVASEKAKRSCQPSFTHSQCHSWSGASSSALERTSQLLRNADTNGALFLAFPANGPQRNSTKDSSSLLHVLCQSENDSKCEGATAPQAEFRSDGGTFPRMLGVLLIAFGVLGMAMLFGLIAAHLLVSALFSLFMLLLAPFVVLAPALGDVGRAVFSGWLTRLLGAVCSKLIFSFVLGALLTMQRMLASLHQLGWWTQWLLISTFWWFVFLRRHQALDFIRSGGQAPAVSTHKTLGQRVRGLRQAKHDLTHPLRWVKDKLLSSSPGDEELGRPGPKRRGSGQYAQGPITPTQPWVEGGDQPTAMSQRQENRMDTWLGQAQPAKRSEHARTVEGLDPNGSQTVQVGPEAVAGESQVTGSRDRAGSVADGDTGSPRRSNKGKKEKPPRGERVARAAAYASDPECDEAALLASAHPPRGSQSPSAQSQQMARQGRQPSPQTAAEPARMPPRRTADRDAPNSQGRRMLTSREIMDDAREVAAGRKRQLGLELFAEGELEA